MRVKFMLATLLLAGCASAPASEPSLVGAWRLERYVDTPEGGPPVTAFGVHPNGLFVFTADGHASINLMANPIPVQGSADPDPDACVPNWYCSYYGAYRVDWARHEWVMHVEGANIPNFIGSDQTRAFELRDNRILITGEYSDAHGRRVRYERVLVRAN
jgi:lipocalin-like protein